MQALELPRLASAEDTGLVLDLAEINTLMPFVATSWVTTVDDVEYQLPAGLLQFWAQEAQGLTGPVEFGVLPNGRPYAQFLFRDAERCTLALQPEEGGHR